jgi:hypothetical protein
MFSSLFVEDYAMKKSVRSSILALLITVLFSGPLSAAGEQEYVIKKTFDSVVPVFMNGHAGDPNWIEGFLYSGEILLDGVVIGTVSGEARLWNPPLDLFAPYHQISLKVTNTITGMGSFEVHAQGLALASSSTHTAGDAVVAWSGSITNGKDAFSDAYGLTSGNIITNFFAGNASGTEVVRIRFGF